MSMITKRLEQAFASVRVLSADEQDLVAVELMERVSALSRPPTALTSDERVELQADLAAAREGAFASEEDVAVLYAKHGL